MRKASESNKSECFGKRLNRMTKPIGFGVVAVTLALLLFTTIKDAQAGTDYGAHTGTKCFSRGPTNYCIGTDEGFRSSSEQDMYLIFANYNGSRIIYVNSPATGRHILTIPSDLAEPFDTAMLSRPEAVKSVGWNDQNEVFYINLNFRFS